MHPGRYQWMSVCVLFAISCSFINGANANHPFHVSTAEVEYNANSNRLEIGLKCQSTDLERALRLMASKKIDIESDPQVDELITRYVTNNFYLAVAPGIAKVETPNQALGQSLSTEAVQAVPEAPQKPIKLIGKEFETKWIWIYFELQPLPGVEPLVLVNRVLFEVNTGQINTCLIRHAGRRHALKSTLSNPLQAFDRKWLAELSSERAPKE